MPDEAFAVGLYGPVAGGVVPAPLRFPSAVGGAPKLRDSAAAGERARLAMAQATEAKKGSLLARENGVPQARSRQKS